MNRQASREGAITRRDESLSDSRWECKCHVVFIRKYREKPIFVQSRRELGEVFRRLAVQKESTLLDEGHTLTDCAHNDLDSTEACGLTGDRVHQG